MTPYPFAERADNFIQRIKSFGWSTFYPLDSGLSIAQIVSELKRGMGTEDEKKPGLF